MTFFSVTFFPVTFFRPPGVQSMFWIKNKKMRQIGFMIQEEGLSVSIERNKHKVLVTCLEDTSPGNIVAGINDHPDMTLSVDWGHKAPKQTNKISLLMQLALLYPSTFSR